jgi:hypothetical protein
MARRGSYVAAVVLAVVTGWIARASATESNATLAAQEPAMAPDARVRGVSPRMVAVISEGAAESKTFRGLVDWISATDGIVYVAEGRCAQGARSCLLATMTIAGPNRVLRILTDSQASDRDLMGSIGHELQHAVEVLSHRRIRSSSEIILLYKEMCNACGLRFETEVAIAAGVAVRAELRQSAAAKRRE